jgi:RNA-directed DNA polymerase
VGRKAHPSRGAVREEKQNGETTRVPARSHKSAEPINAGEGAISAAPIRPASKTVMGRDVKSALEASVEKSTRQRGNGRDGRKASGAPVPFSPMGTRGRRVSDDQRAEKPARAARQNPHGVKLDPTTVKGISSEPETQTIVSCGMAKVTGEHDGLARSPHSSQRAGKPSTGRRGTVDTVGKQEGDGKPSALVNTEVILDMQRKLYRWSRSDPDKVFFDLFNLICDRRTLNLAWKNLCRNQGSRTPGIDGVTRQKIEEGSGGVPEFLERLREELRTGRYQPRPVRQKLIPKPGKPGKFRPLGIPTLRDRLVQMAVKIILEPIFEAGFHPNSYGFRRGRSTMDAITVIQHQLHPTRAGQTQVTYVIEGDIKACFDNVDHHLLMEEIRKRIGDKKVLRLIHSFLKAGVMAEGEIRHPVAGTPQGGIISPLLANVYLSAIDKRYERWSSRPNEPPYSAAQRRRRDRSNGKPTFYMVRYADDFIVLSAGTKDDAEQEKANLASFLQKELHMELSEEKTLITDPRNGFQFLGYRMILARALRTGHLVGKVRIPKTKLQMLRDRMKSMTSMSTIGYDLGTLLKKLNPIIAGWRNYYRYAIGAAKDFAQLDRWLWHRLQRWFRKKHSRITAHEVRRRYARRDGPARWTWGTEKETLRRFTSGGTARYIARGYRISNGWNDKLDGVSFYPEVANTISGFTWLGETLR